MPRKTPTTAPAAGVRSGTVGQSQHGPFVRWRQANFLLAGAVLLLGAFQAWSAYHPDTPPAPDDSVAALPAGPVAAPPPAADWRKHMMGKNLFVIPVAAPAGPELADLVAKAKEKVTLRGITKVGSRWGAYFEVRQGAQAAGIIPGRRARPGQPPPRPVQSKGGSMSLFFEGDRVGEFTVKKIEPRTVTLLLGDKEVLFAL